MAPRERVARTLTAVAARTSVRLAIAIALVCALPFACGDDSPLSPHDARALSRARARWEANGGASYTVESRISCFCAPHLFYWTRITVRDGVVVGAVPVEDLPDGINSELSGWLTVDEIFGIVASPAAVVSRVRVSFDPALGYPTRVETTCAPNIADCGAVREMRGLIIDG